MQNLYLIQEVPNTDLSWILYTLVGVFIVVIIIGSLTYQKKEIGVSRSKNETSVIPNKLTNKLIAKKIKK